MRVKFLENRTTKNGKVEFPKGTYPEGDQFKKGETYDLSEASAKHWLNRGVAVLAEDDPPARKPTKPEALVPAAPAKGV